MIGEQYGVCKQNVFPQLTPNKTCQRETGSKKTTEPNQNNLYPLKTVISVHNTWEKPIGTNKNEWCAVLLIINILISYIFVVSLPLTTHHPDIEARMTNTGRTERFLNCSPPSNFQFQISYKDNIKYQGIFCVDFNLRSNHTFKKVQAIVSVL